nr:unnamed protein product [Digitaria exilis]
MQMKERQRWRPEEDAVLLAYVRQYGPREWHLISQRMNVGLERDAKSCLERWRNYLRPGIKKGSLTDDEQRLVIRLQAKHGNKWKKIAAEVPGRTAKRYDWLLENFAEKLVGERPPPPPPSVFMAGAPVLPPWLSSSSSSNSGSATAVVTQQPGPPPRPPSPSVTLCLASAAAVAPPPPPPGQWIPAERGAAEAAAAAYGFTSPPQHAGPPGGGAPAPVGMAVVDGSALAELAECCRELEEGQRAWAAHRREAAWRLKRVEQQLMMEREMRRREVWEEYEAKMHAMRVEQAAAAERVEREHREKVAELRRDAQLKEEKMAEQWAAKHARVAKFLEQVGCSRPWPSAGADMN